jgi:hypothetical protein
MKNTSLVALTIIAIQFTGCSKKPDTSASTPPTTKTNVVAQDSQLTPKAFLFVYPFGPTNDQNRLWLRGDDNNWTEHCQYGPTSQFKTMVSAQVEGNSGTIVRRVSDEAMEVFIPNVNASGNNPQWLRHRSIPNGDWQFLGQIQIEGN